VLVIVGPLLTASMIRFEVAATLIMQRNQRPVRRSYSTRGSEMPIPPETELQKVASVTFKLPSVPVNLSKTFTRPFTCMRTWVGPTSPTLSGGIALMASAFLPGPAMFVPMVCGRSIERGEVGLEV